MLTAQEILLEFAKCLQDPCYVIENYLQTFDKTQKGFVPFVLFPRQREIIKSYEKFKKNIVTKPRQAGVSTTTAAYLATKVAFADPGNPEAILIIANKQELAMEFLSKIKEFLSQIPRWVWGPEYFGTPETEAKELFSTKSKKEIKLPNGCRVKAVATSKDALRGFTPTYLVMDEAAYIENGSIVFGAAMASLGTGGHSMLISTPNGMDSLYYKTYNEAKANKNGFNIIEMRWYEDLRYNKGLKWIKKQDSGETEVVTEFLFTFQSYNDKLKNGYKPTSPWYEDMCAGFNNDPKTIAQELDVSFIGSGGNVIDEKYIDFQEKQNVMEPKHIIGENGEIWIWQYPIAGHKYIAGVDVSRGDGEDSSTIVIIDFTTMEQVMEYQGKIQPDLLAYVVREYGDLYNAYTVVDITGGMGVSTVLKLLELGYKRLHYDVMHNPNLTNYMKDNKTPGFTINSVRTPMVAHLEHSIRENLVKVRSSRLCEEMKTFIFKKGKADHMSGYHDDLLMSLAMGLWVLEHAFKNLEKAKEQTKAMLNSWIGGDALKQKQTKPNFSPLVARNMQDPRGDYAWLFGKRR